MWSSGFRRPLAEDAYSSISDFALHEVGGMVYYSLVQFVTIVAISEVMSLRVVVVNLKGSSPGFYSPSLTGKSIPVFSSVQQCMKLSGVFNADLYCVGRVLQSRLEIYP